MVNFYHEKALVGAFSVIVQTSRTFFSSSTENGRICVSYEWGWWWCDKCDPDMLTDIPNTEHFLSAALSEKITWNGKPETRTLPHFLTFLDFRAECCISGDPNMGLHSLYSIKSPQMWTQILGPLCPVLLAAVACHVSRVTLRNTDTKMLWMSSVICVDTWRFR